jgi:hypothetical protein
MFLLIELCTIKIVCHSIAYLRSEITFTSQWKFRLHCTFIYGLRKNWRPLTGDIWDLRYGRIDMIQCNCTRCDKTGNLWLMVRPVTLSSAWISLFSWIHCMIFIEPHQFSVEVSYVFKLCRFWEAE